MTEPEAEPVTASVSFRLGRRAECSGKVPPPAFRAPDETSVEPRQAAAASRTLGDARPDAAARAVHAKISRAFHTQPGIATEPGLGGCGHRGISNQDRATADPTVPTGSGRAIARRAVAPPRWPPVRKRSRRGQPHSRILVRIPGGPTDSRSRDLRARPEFRGREGAAWRRGASTRDHPALSEGLPLVRRECECAPSNARSFVKAAAAHGFTESYTGGQPTAIAALPTGPPPGKRCGGRSQPAPALATIRAHTQPHHEESLLAIRE